MCNLKRQKKRSLTHKYIRTLQRWGKKVKRVTRVNNELRQKNSTLVGELQKERIKSSTLHNDLNYLQYENFNVLNNLLSNRGSLADFLVQTSEVHTCIEGLAGWLVAGSTWLARIQGATKKIELQIKNMQKQHGTDERNSSPVSSRRQSLSQRRKFRTVEASREDLDVIEEVSHESSISPTPQLMASGSRYERRCKRGLRCLLSTRTETNRKSTRISLKSNGSNTGSSQNEKPPQTLDESQLDASNLDVSQEHLNESQLDESDEASDESKIIKSDEALDGSGLDKTSDETEADMSMEVLDSAELSDAENKASSDASIRESTSNNRNSCASDCSSHSAGCSKKAKYSDILKSHNSSFSNESNQSDHSNTEERADETNESLAKNSLSPQSNLEQTNLDSPEDRKPDVSSLSSITVRRGTIRHTSTSELVRNNLSSCSSTPKKNMQLENSNIRASPPDSDCNKSTASASSITYRRHYKQRDSFTFYAVPEWSNSSKRKSTNETTIKATKSVNESTIKARKTDKENKEPNETIVPKTKEKKKGRKPKKVSTNSNADCALSNSYQLFASENSRISGKKSSSGKKQDMISSTPQDSVKLSKNRQPLETIASSTRFSANESKLSKTNRCFSLSETLSLSPILNCPKDQQSLRLDETDLSFNNSSTMNNDSSGNQRPRRNAAQNKNYKELPLSKKMRRNH